MNTSSLSLVWCQVLALLALEVALIALGVALVQRWTRWAAWRRTFCQAGITAVLVIAACELTGSARMPAGWVTAKVNRPERSAAGAAVVGRESQIQNLRFHIQRDGTAGEGQTLTRVDGATARQTEPAPGAQTKTAKSHLLPGDPLTAPAEPKSLSFGSVSKPAPRDSEAISDPLVVLGICMVWGLGAVLVSGRAGLARCLFVLFRLRCPPIEDPALLRRLGALARTMGMSRPVRVIESARLADPIAFGFIRPTVGLPPGFGARFDPAKQEAMLAHELAHLAAHDPFWCCLADVGSVVLWWHPAVWWLRRQLHLASEMAADEASLLVADGPRALAECLVELGARALQPRLGQMSASGFRSHLGRRVQRLVCLKGAWGPGPHRFRAALTRTLGPVAMAVIVVLCTAWAAPQGLRTGDSIKTMQLTWKRSLETFTLLAAVHGPEATPKAMQGAQTAAVVAGTGQAVGEGQAQGAAVEGLRLCIRPSKARIAVGEPIILDLSLLNDTGQGSSARRRIFLPWGVDRPGPYLVHLIDPHGEERNFSAGSDNGGPGQIICLDAGELHGRRVTCGL